MANRMFAAMYNVTVTEESICNGTRTITFKKGHVYEIHRTQEIISFIDKTAQSSQVAYLGDAAEVLMSIGKEVFPRMTRLEAIVTASKYGLQREVAWAIDHGDMSPEEALEDWDII